MERRGRRTSQDVRAGGSAQDGSDESGLGGGAAGAPARQVAAVGTPLGWLARAGSCSPVEEVGLAGAAEPAGWAPDVGAGSSVVRAAATSCGLSSARAVGGVTGI
ncbi:hypothetical protein [Kocuria rhizophila]|uniref:hypothetical protein n=1 Tax=Kocuria rhizophila TaxID=72000 RepID=UPI001F1884C5|nr:hypothetical protein [Kocuria rhizophila]